MNALKAGFSCVNINPTLGTPLRGYYQDRFAAGVLDDLQIRTIALAVGDKKALLISVDTCAIETADCNAFRSHLQDVTGIPKEAIFIHATHNHTSPFCMENHPHELVREYFHFLYRRLADGAMLALQDLQPARVGWAVGNAPKVGFVRRFRMKDGSVRTNPGVGNPDILHPIGDVDERVNVLRIDREGADTLVLVNFGNHPDVVGGCKVSADWPGFLRLRLEKALDNVKCVFFNGAQGDVNHVNVHAKGGDFNDTFRDFDDVDRGYGHARHIGNVMAAGVLQVYDKVNYVEVDRLDYLEKVVHLPSNMPTKEQAVNAHVINDLHNAGRDAEIPFHGMELTTVVAEAARMVQLEHGPESFGLTFTGIALGDLAFISVPGEPFTGVGRGLKEAEGWAMVLPCCLTNGYEGYFPMMDAYEEGGYEARSSRFKAGVAELMIQEGKAILDALK